MTPLTPQELAVITPQQSFDHVENKFLRATMVTRTALTTKSSTCGMSWAFLWSNKTCRMKFMGLSLFRTLLWKANDRRSSKRRPWSRTKDALNKGSSLQRQICKGTDPTWPESLNLAMNASGPKKIFFRHSVSMKRNAQPWRRRNSNSMTFSQDSGRKKTWLTTKIDQSNLKSLEVHDCSKFDIYFIN